MAYDYKIYRTVAILDEELPTGLAMNALGHSAVAVGFRTDPSWMGQTEIVDLDNNKHMGISKYPFIILKGTKDQIKEISSKSKSLGIYTQDFTQDMIDTSTDEELVESLSKKKESEIVYRGVILMGETSKIKEITKHLSLYK